MVPVPDLSSSWLNIDRCIKMSFIKTRIKVIKLKANKHVAWKNMRQWVTISFDFLVETSVLTNS